MTPKITVITPTYNRADLLPKTIDSILKQTVENFEYIIIDDGSIDNTREIVEPYLADTRVKYVFQDNAGEPAAVNHGWSLAKGEYFVQVNSDDPVLPNLFEEMIKAMDQNPNAIVAYCDFHFIDENDAIMQTVHNATWDFHALLSMFSCTAAAPGTFFRRTGPLSKWGKIRRTNYKYINDIEMYWDMALEGDFIHVPKVLATRRENATQISNARYESIEEIWNWFHYYFSKPDLPEDVAACKYACKKYMTAQSVTLISESDLDEEEKLRRIYAFQKELFLDGQAYSCLQVGDTDLIGNKFNGHNLHLLLEQHGINAWHIVRSKESSDPKTIALPVSEKDYSQQILRRKEFLFSDIVHLHLIHNTDFDVKMLPLITKLKPTVFTLHDPFFLGGHCIHHFECEKWKNQCFFCPHPESLFSLIEDDSALRFAVKERYIQDSDISVIVASDWMQEKVKQSPVFRGKKIYKLPFGIDQSIFLPADSKEARLALNIPVDDLVLFFRIDTTEFKGLETIQEALRALAKESIRATILTVGQDKNLLKEFDDKFNILEFGWLKDDRALAQLYQAADLFLMPSNMETFGMMAVEAMSCGKMVLAIPGTALASVIGSPHCGMIAKKEDYAETLLMLVQNRKILAERGERSLAFARERYSLDEYINGMLDIYRDVIERFEPAPSNISLLSSLSLLTETPEYIPHTLYKTLSWKITKPLRVFINLVRGMKAGQINAIKNAFAHEKAEEHPSDAVIVETTSWKISAPLRAIRGFIRPNPIKHLQSKWSDK